jgi:hypothetical protein
MKKTVKKMNLHRETLRWLTGGAYINQTGQTGTGVSVPSCVDGCPSAMVMCTSVTTLNQTNN